MTLWLKDRLFHFENFETKFHLWAFALKLLDQLGAPALQQGG